MPLHVTDMNEMQTMIAEHLALLSRQIGNGQLRVLEANVDYETETVHENYGEVRRAYTGVQVITLKIVPETDKVGD